MINFKSQFYIFVNCQIIIDKTFSQSLELKDMLQNVVAPERVYTIPKHIKYIVDIFDFDFLDYFIGTQYTKFDNILHIMKNEKQMAQLFTAYYFQDTGKIVNILLVCVIYKNPDLFATICGLLYWKWVQIKTKANY